MDVKGLFRRFAARVPFLDSFSRVSSDPELESLSEYVSQLTAATGLSWKADRWSSDPYSGIFL